MTIRYRQIQSIAGLGGYVTPMWLSPVIRPVDPLTNEYMGVIDELSLLTLPIGLQIFRLPPISQVGTGRICGFKMLIGILPPPITVLPTAGEDGLLAGIEDQDPFTMVTLSQGGCSALFVSITGDIGGINPPPPNTESGGYWLLVNYLPGTTFAF